MTVNPRDVRAHEIVIVRRRSGGEEEGHHGGVWKIAYADFMTAMMAFFLVMWLMASTDEKTLSQVAAYFNPLKLTDKVTESKGVRDMQYMPKPGNEDSDTPTRKQGDAGERAYKQKYQEEALFRDPFGLLSQLASQAPKDYAVAAGGPDAGDAGALPPVAAKPAPQPEGGDPPALPPPDILTDPLAVPVPPKGTKAEVNRDETKPETFIPFGRFEAEATEGDDQASAGTDDAPSDGSNASSAAQDTSRPAPPSAPEVAARSEAAPEASSRERELAAEAAQIEQHISEAMRQISPGLAPDVEVRAVPEGVLISVNDKDGFGMFGIGSARPEPATVAFMERIGDVLKSQPGPFVIRGHTDGRQYRDPSQGGNWRLSADRAQMAYFMLARGGLDETKLTKIEGHADRSLRNAADPLAAGNRRIEILLIREQR